MAIGCYGWLCVVIHGLYRCLVDVYVIWDIASIENLKNSAQTWSIIMKCRTKKLYCMT